MRWRLDARHGTCGVPKPLSPFLRALKAGLLPRGVWPQALAREATLPDVIL
jgi:hypothetical protein